MKSALCEHAGIEVPLICGAMYPCSNPELIAAVSAAGGIGVIQPVAFEYAHRTSLRDGIKKIRAITDKPIGFNALVEKTAQAYEDRMRRWIDVALEEGIRFFVTGLGDPGWVADAAHAVGGVVYHDVTDRRWAEKALDRGADGLICVNRRAGGHAGEMTAERLYEDLEGLGAPLVCAGGIGDETAFARALALGYAGAQLGTRFIATTECSAHDDYKQAILQAQESDIVLTEKISGVPVAVIKSPYIERVGTKAGFVARRLLRHRKAKRYVRMYYSLRSFWQLKRSSARGLGYKDYFLAGKSVGGIDRVESAEQIVHRFAAAAAERASPTASIGGCLHSTTDR